MKSNTSTFSNLYAGNINAMKGLLILLVVMDHNDLLRTLVPNLFRPLTFHVIGFLALPFFTPSKMVSITFLRDRLVRYLVPFLWVLTCATVLYSTLFRSDGFGTVVLDWFSAAMIGSAPLVKSSTGFYYLWFLPTLLGLVAILAIYQSIGAAWRVVIIAIATLCHLAISVVPAAFLEYLPFGIPIVLWMFPIGLILKWAIENKRVYRLRYLVLVTFVASYGYLAMRGQNLEVMTLNLKSLSDPLLFVLQDVSAVTGVIVSIWCASLLGNLRFVNEVGKYSLMVYLIHPLIFFFGYRLSGVGHWQLDPVVYFGLAAGSVALTAVLALFASTVIARVPMLHDWITPVNWNGWRAAQIFRRRKKELGA